MDQRQPPSGFLLSENRLFIALSEKDADLLLSYMDSIIIFFAYLITEIPSYVVTKFLMEVAGSFMFMSYSVVLGDYNLLDCMESWCALDYSVKSPKPPEIRDSTTLAKCLYPTSWFRSPKGGYCSVISIGSRRCRRQHSYK